MIEPVVIGNAILYLGDCLEWRKRPRTDTWKENIAKALRRGDTFSCLVCGKEFWRKPSAIKKGDCKFCSRHCYQEWQQGRSRSDEFRQKCSGRNGESNPNWRGGIDPINKRLRNSDEYMEWRHLVFERDDYTCQECLANGVYLHAHHIQPFALFPELRFDVANGLTLCVKCHTGKPKGREILAIGGEPNVDAATGE